MVPAYISRRMPAFIEGARNPPSGGSRQRRRADDGRAPSADARTTPTGATTNWPNRTSRTAQGGPAMSITLTRGHRRGTTSEVDSGVAARAVDATKVYGRG